MTDDERPTLPGTFDAPELDEDSDQQNTLPPLEPAPRLDDTPVARPPRDRGFRTTDPGLRAVDREPAGATLRPPPQSAKPEAIEELTLGEEEIDTWRPPPPTPAPAAVTGSVGVADPSSIAPRELARRQPPSGRRAVSWLGAAILLIGAGTLLLRRADRADPQPRADAAPTVPARSLAAAPRPEARPSPIAPAPVAGDPAEPAVPSATDTASRDVALSASAQRLALGPTARPRIASKAPRAPRPAVVPTELPEMPSRKDVAGSLDGLRSAIQACSDGRSGVAEVDLTINGSGAVAHALVSGDFAGTPQGSCMARALRGARFAPFQKPKFRVLYRFML